MAAGFRITNFGGIIPRLSDRGLPENAAQFALNAKLYSGELRAWLKLKPLSALSISNAQTVYHYRTTVGADAYLAFPTFTNVVKAPLVNETLGRLYWTPEAGGGMVNTITRIQAAQPAFKLGVPPPTGTFTVVPTGGTAATAETRVYVVTLETSFGEESAPAGQVSVSGNADGTWTVNGLNALTIDTANYPNITTLKLYRTLTSATGVDYRLVNSWAIGARPASYVDNVSATTLSAREVLDSLGWDLPPADLKGLISVAGGFLAGFTGRTVRLSVPYQPHAWPVDYSYAVDDEIVGLGTFGNTIVICTQGRGQMLVGPQPDAMSLVKMEGVQPCLSKRGIVSSTGAVMYPSTDGLAAVDGSSNRAQIVSRMWVTKDEWLSRFSPSTLKASVYQDRYLAFYTSQLGFTIGFDDPVTGFTELQYEGVSSVDLDTLTGQTMITVGSTVYEWDADSSGVLLYTWRSKPFMLTKPANMAAIQLRGDFIGSGTNPDVPTIPAQGIGGYAMNDIGINAGKDQGANIAFAGAINGAATWMAMGTPPAPPAPGPEVAVKVYADGVLRWIGAIDDESVYRLPSGYKAVTYEIEVQGVSPLYSVVIADTAKGLENIP
jgi:hypothetical protein